MTANEPASVLRLRKKHGDGSGRTATAADGARIAATQNLRAALTAGLIAIIVFSALWVLLTGLLGRIYPWATVLLGFLVGHAVRVAGRGIDWRFSLLAAILAALGAVTANIVVAASGSAEDLGAGTLDVLRAVTTMTWPVFFGEEWNFGDTVFAGCAAALAAFFAQRRLSRDQYYALRLWREEQQRD